MSSSSALEAGKPAPAFSGPTQTGETISLKQFRGQKIALFFYPKDNTPGCTKQACNLRDNYKLLETEGIAVIGVSHDPVESHVKFSDKFDLPFPLIADTDRDILDAYGVWIEKSMYGRKYMGTKRTTVLIDESGMIRHIIEKPKVGQHAEEIIKLFSEPA
jgi:peroxiredoxin Q/BCP